LKVAATIERSMSSRGGRQGDPLIQTGSARKRKRAKKQSFQGNNNKNLRIRPREASIKKSGQK
jgi:hypothetical protein